MTSLRALNPSTTRPQTRLSGTRLPHARSHPHHHLNVTFHTPSLHKPPALHIISQQAAPVTVLVARADSDSHSRIRTICEPVPPGPPTSTGIRNVSLAARRTTHWTASISRSSYTHCLGTELICPLHGGQSESPANGSKQAAMVTSKFSGPANHTGTGSECPVLCSALQRVRIQWSTVREGIT